MKYKKKPDVVEAIHWDGGNLQEVMAFVGAVNRDKIRSYYHAEDLEYEITLNTHEGWETVDVGDWIVKDGQGEFYPCKPWVFEKQYEPVEG